MRCCDFCCTEKYLATCVSCGEPYDGEPITGSGASFRAMMVQYPRAYAIKVWCEDTGKESEFYPRFCPFCGRELNG